MHWTLSDLIADISQNACESGGTAIELSVDENESELRFSVKDNGSGMSEAAVRQALDPFATDGVKHPHRKIGLGLPFLVQTAEQSGGSWHIDSKLGVGTEVSAYFDSGNIDRPPVGDLPGMFRSLLFFPGPSEVLITRSGRQQYTIRKTELMAILGDCEDSQSLILAGQYIRSLEEGI
jgi:hypothetical protein